MYTQSTASPVTLMQSWSFVEEVELSQSAGVTAAWSIEAARLLGPAL